MIMNIEDTEYTADTKACKIALRVSGGFLGFAYTVCFLSLIFHEYIDGTISSDRDNDDMGITVEYLFFSPLGGFMGGYAGDGVHNFLRDWHFHEEGSNIGNVLRWCGIMRERGSMSSMERGSSSNDGYGAIPPQEENEGTISKLLRCCGTICKRHNKNPFQQVDDVAQKKKILSPTANYNLD